MSIFAVSVTQIISVVLVGQTSKVIRFSFGDIRVASSDVPRNFVRGEGVVETNSVEDRGQRERGSGGGSPLVRGSGGSCNLVQEI